MMISFLKDLMKNGIYVHLGSRVYNLFMLNLTEHEIYPAHAVKMPTFVGLLNLYCSKMLKCQQLLAFKIYEQNKYIT